MAEFPVPRFSINMNVNNNERIVFAEIIYETKRIRCRS
jgi:hypothetical protein